MIRSLSIAFLLAWALPAVAPARAAQAAELHIGAATVSITPELPVPLSGQMRTRIATQVESPLTATVLALESRRGGVSSDQLVMVSCDLVAIREGILERVRRSVRERLPDLDPQKLVLSATHTHTAPVMEEGRYNLPAEGLTQPAQFVAFLVERVTDGVVEAWQGRRPGLVGWGLGHAVVTQNRRSVYADGSARMYGPTDSAEFRILEGYEDHGVEVLFFWSAPGRLLATAVNLACPAQEVESRSAINADFWHEVRAELRRRHGEQLHVLGWTGASGDQSPHLMYRKRAEERMRELRGLTRLEEISRRIVQAWEEAYQGAQKDARSDAVLQHEVHKIQLPLRRITAREAAEAGERAAEFSKDPDQRWRARWHQSVATRFQAQQEGTSQPYEMELHVARLGEVAIATNPFELFTDFGVQMKARSRALQTFVIQLAGPGTYLPSQRAVEGGGYGAIPESTLVGPEGGQLLVDRTVQSINSLFPAP